MKEHYFNNKANAKEGTDGEKLKNIETDCDMGLLIIIIIIIKNNIIIIIRTFPACFAPEKFLMLNNSVNLWSKMALCHVVFTLT